MVEQSAGYVSSVVEPRTGLPQLDRGGRRWLLCTSTTGLRSCPRQSWKTYENLPGYTACTGGTARRLRIVSEQGTGGGQPYQKPCGECAKAQRRGSSGVPEKALQNYLYRKSWLPHYGQTPCLPEVLRPHPHEVGPARDLPAVELNPVLPRFRRAVGEGHHPPSQYVVDRNSHLSPLR
jgi:hypothetical protein